MTMSESKIIHDVNENFEWEKPKTEAHDYILKIVNMLMNKIGFAKDAKILDAGCGGGYILNRLYNNGYKNIWGIDISENGITLAKDTYKHIENRFSLHNAYLRKMPSNFPDRDYDLILSVEVIEHLTNPKMYLQNIHYWLTDGGTLMITTPYHGYIKNVVIALLNKFDSHVDSISECGHIKFFSKKTLSDILKQTGFENIHFYGSGRVPYLWKSMIVVSKKIS